MSLARTLLALGRISNLPTVWSNCLAGWWLGGGGNLSRLPFLFAGATLLYVGGMFLNDALDVDFDRQHRPERPIPSGAISQTAVMRLALISLPLGAACLLSVGRTSGLVFALILCIVVYSVIHKRTPFSTILMGACRFLVYLIAAAAAIDGVTGWAVWCGLALMIYVIGLSCVARGESLRGPLRYWPFALLIAPVVLAMIMNVDGYRQPALLLSGILVLWIVRALGPMFWEAERRIDRTISRLLAGIVFVDLLAVPNVPMEPGTFFLILFLTAVLLQRFVAAT